MNGLGVQPQNNTLGCEPVKSPKFSRHHNIQASAGNTAHAVRTKSAGNAFGNLPARHKCKVKNASVTTETASKGRLVILVRKVAASARPVMTPSRQSNVSARKSRSRQTNAIPKQTGDKTSL